MSGPSPVLKDLVIATFNLFDFGETKGSQNTSHGFLAHSEGEENAILVDEENLKAGESHKALYLFKTLLAIKGSL